MSARTSLIALAASILALGVATALIYRSAAGGGIAMLGLLVLLALALGVAWASGVRRR